jgi:hypothetical protein
MGWTVDGSGFDSWKVQEIFLYSIASIPALGPSHPPIQWVPGMVSPEVKRPGREADHFYLVLGLRIVDLMASGFSVKLSTGITSRSRNSSVDTVTGSMAEVWFPAWAEDFSLYHNFQTGSGAHTDSYTMFTGGSFLGAKADRAWSWLFISI